MLHISKGNTKLGRIPNSSLRPVKDCINCSYCKKQCYALRCYNQYPSVKKAWDDNSRLLRTNLSKYILDHIRFLDKHVPPYFRFNVGGDIISERHWLAINVIALEQLYKTKFLIFTKSFKFIKANIEPNLSVVLSLFPGMKAPRHLKHLPRAYAYEKLTDYGNDERFKEAIECVGSCETCGMCFSLKDLGRDVRFLMH